MMTRRFITPADTAKLIRKALKASHPATKFSVRTSVYSGGASIRIAWRRYSCIPTSESRSPSKA